MQWNFRPLESPYSWDFKVLELQNRISTKCVSKIFKIRSTTAFTFEHLEQKMVDPFWGVSTVHVIRMYSNCAKYAFAQSYASCMRHVSCKHWGAHVLSRPAVNSSSELGWNWRASRSQFGRWAGRQKHHSVAIQKAWQCQRSHGASWKFLPKENEVKFAKEIESTPSNASLTSIADEPFLWPVA